MEAAREGLVNGLSSDSPDQLYQIALSLFETGQERLLLEPQVVEYVFSTRSLANLGMMPQGALSAIDSIIVIPLQRQIGEQGLDSDDAPQFQSSLGVPMLQRSPAFGRGYNRRSLPLIGSSDPERALELFYKLYIAFYGSFTEPHPGLDAALIEAAPLKVPLLSLEPIWENTLLSPLQLVELSLKESPFWNDFANWLRRYRERYTPLIKRDPLTWLQPMLEAGALSLLILVNDQLLPLVSLPRRDKSELLRDLLWWCGHPESFYTSAMTLLLPSFTGFRIRESARDMRSFRLRSNSGSSTEEALLLNVLTGSAYNSPVYRFIFQGLRRELAGRWIEILVKEDRVEEVEMPICNGGEPSQRGRARFHPDLVLNSVEGMFLVDPFILGRFLQELNESFNNRSSRLLWQRWSSS